MNFIIKETQLESIIKNLNESFRMDKVSAMRKIIEILKNKGWEPVQAIDFIIGLRLNDEFTKAVSQQFQDDPEFIDAVEKVTTAD